MAVSSAGPRAIAARKWLCAIVIVLSAVMPRAPHAAALQATGKFTEFPLPNPNSGPTTESNANRIGRMKQDGTGHVEFDLPHPGSAPRINTVVSDGDFWFSEHLVNRMGRITKDGAIAEFEIPTPNSQPRATALGADGNVWFGEFAGGKIGRVTPAGVITEFPIPTPDSGPRALAAGPDGNIWFSEFNASKIGRITTAGAITEFVLPRPNSGPGDITAGADGAMWFVELAGRMDGRQPDGNRVGRITLTGSVSEFPIPSANGSPINIAVGPDRNIWFTKAGKLGRVTPDGVITEFDIPPGGGPTGLSAGSDRCPPTRLIDKLWFTAGNKLA